VLLHLSAEGTNLFTHIKNYLKMKSLLIILCYTGVFMGMFFLLSTIGLLWIDSYHAIISDPNWFMMYFLFFGWWMAALPTKELYDKIDADM